MLPEIQIVLSFVVIISIPDEKLFSGACITSYFVKIIWCSSFASRLVPLILDSILLCLRSPKYGCCSILDYLSCFWIKHFYLSDEGSLRTAKSFRLSNCIYRRFSKISTCDARRCLTCHHISCESTITSSINCYRYGIKLDKDTDCNRLGQDQVTLSF